MFPQQNALLNAAVMIATAGSGGAEPLLKLAAKSAFSHQEYW